MAAPELDELLIDGPATAARTLVLAHGAGAPMDDDFMADFAAGLAGPKLRVVRFEFDYMARRRIDGRRRPPDPAPRLIARWRSVIEVLGGPRGLAIGGKSLGGRMASLLAAELEAESTPVAAVVCLGYPFHPPDKPERLRTAHLAALRTPCLICQGSRDPFGTREEVAGYALSPAIRLHWAEDGDHRLRPRKASGRSTEDNWAAAMAAISDFLAELR